ncbi:kcnl-1 [Pristionchus pacificus]|uniref:Kcnl-1 n=1 Tax=Pristionchus pacificus TaxID=54126 RepID=A0A2A6C640_PRIPA|nr:kcnl-1 [Pristionchus pacificus]|eukprot:PDM73619.1 kcnl-1 [Pristionchus pacificus]
MNARRPRSIRGARMMPKYSDSVLHYHLRPELVRLQLQNGISSTLDRRHGRSCDLNAAIREENEHGRDFGSRMNNNPIAQHTLVMEPHQYASTLFVPGQEGELERRRTMPKRKSIVAARGAPPHHTSPRRDRAASMFSVSSDILRVSGYSNQFRSLLTARLTPRRDSSPNVCAEEEAVLDKTDEKVGNGGVRFDVEHGKDPARERNNSSCAKSIVRRRSRYGISISSDSTAKMRCRQRKQLFVTRNKVCDLSLLLAIAGLIFVIIDAELTALSSHTHILKSHPISLALRGACVIATVLLIACLIRYHSIEVKIALIDSGADDWRVAVSCERAVKLCLEILVCSICPFPGTGSINWPHINAETRAVKMIPVPVDALLAVPMFLRSYLLCRFMVLHSKQFQVLVVFTVSYWICMSWMFTQCERYDEKLTSEHYYLNSMWFIMVTFMSIGYGDIVPNTYCGRTLSIATGIVGAGVSSALIAVISRKLELSRAEKHVNNFMADSKLTNQRKNAAASVLQETWFIHKYKKMLHKGDDLRLRHHQRRFLHSINEFRRIKWDQRKLQEKGNTLLDVGKLHSDMHETLWEMHRTQDHFISQVDLLTQKIVELQATLVQQAAQGHYNLLPLAGCSRQDSEDPLASSQNPLAVSPSAPTFSYQRQNSSPYPQDTVAARLAVPQGGGTPVMNGSVSAREPMGNGDANGTNGVSNSRSSPHSLQYSGSQSGSLPRYTSLDRRVPPTVTTPLMHSFDSDMA